MEKSMIHFFLNRGVQGFKSFLAKPVTGRLALLTVLWGSKCFISTLWYWMGTKGNDRCRSV